MKILLTGGGSGGHITPLLAVAHELKRIQPNIVIIAACEKNGKFASLYERDGNFEQVWQIAAGKFRRYAGESWLRRLTDIRTMYLNFRDIFRTIRGYRQAKWLLKRERPDIILIKGGFVAVPIGLAAARLKIPFITHDSDSTPGLANRIIGRWARLHATGMPEELYMYPRNKTVYTGVPVSDKFTGTEKGQARQVIGLKDAEMIVAVIGGSQGGSQLNDDMVSIAPQLMERFTDLGIAHIAGPAHQKTVRDAYSRALGGRAEQVVVTGFVDNVYDYTGAADVVVSRASATAITELGIQEKATILVPGRLAGGHQHKNADYFKAHDAALEVESGDREGLLRAICELLENSSLRELIAANLHEVIKPGAAEKLAKLVLAEGGKGND